MGNNCSELSPRPHEVCLIQHPYQLEQYNKYLDSQNIFLISPTALIINNNDATNNNQSHQTENNAQCSNNNNKDSSSILIELNPPSTSSPHDDANVNANADVDADAVEVDDSHVSSSIPKDDTKETPIQDSNKKRKKRNSINNNNNNNLFTKLLTKKPITNLGMASNIAFAKMLAKHKNKVSNKQLKLQKKSKTCQNIKKPNIIQPLNTNINNYNTNTNTNNNNNDNMSKSKYRASTPNLLDVITNAIESVSNKNIITSDITAEVGKSYLNTFPNKDNNNSNNRKEQCIINNKELVTNLSNINSSLGEMNESSVSDVLPLTNQLKINYNITNNISYQAETFQITPSSEYVANKSKMHQIENEMQFTLMHACSHRMKQQRIELLQQFSINNEVNHNENIFVKEDSFIHNHNKQNENFVQKVSQLLSLDKNNQLVFHKLNSEQSIQFSILESSTKANTNTNTNTQSVMQLKKELEIPLRTPTEPLTPCVHNTFHSKLSFNPRSITHLHLMKQQQQQHTTNESNKTSNRISGANCSSDMNENNERDETETITEFNNRTSVLNASCHISSIGGGANGNNVKGSNSKMNKHIKERRKRDKLLTKNTFLKEVVLSSELKKVNVVNDKVSYANRFCVLTEAELKTFKSREEFVLVKPPLLVIALASVVNVSGGVSVDNANGNNGNGGSGSNNKMQGKDKMHYFMVKYKKGKGENSGGGNGGNEVEGGGGKDENNSNNKEGVGDIEVEYFGTADVKLMKEWVKEIKFSIDNANMNANANVNANVVNH